MIKQTPPHIMTTEERLSEITHILAQGFIRSRQRRLNEMKGKTEGFRDSSTGLHRQAKHACHERNRKELNQ